MSSTLHGVRGLGPRLVSLALCAYFALAAAPVRADAPPPAEPQLQDLAAVLPDLLRGGYVIYLRHEMTETAGKGEGGDIARCETQRNLSVAGRAEAAELGRAIRALGIPVGRVFSSPFCRCKDTATLAFGHYEVVADLHFALGASADERERLAAVLREMLATRPAPGVNNVIVAHTANLREAAGIWPKPEGVAFVFRPLGNGRFEALARILPRDWSELAIVGKR
jgi:phosphohistidine phosphatase SixA